MTLSSVLPVHVVLDSCVTRHSVRVKCAQEQRTFNWGGKTLQTTIATTAPKESPGGWLGEETGVLPVIAQAAKEGAVVFYRGLELTWEAAHHRSPTFVTGPASPFQGLSINSVPDPVTSGRVLASYDDQLGDGSRRWLDFLSGLDHPRYLEILHEIGGNKPEDAFHLWGADAARIPLFLTTDKKLMNSVKNARQLKLGTTLLRRDQLQPVLLCVRAAPAAIRDSVGSEGG